MAEGPDPPREHKDHALRWLVEHLRNPSPRVFGVPCPEQVQALSPVIPLLETRTAVVDGLVRGVSDGSIWSLEFEMGTPDHGRLIEHHVAVARAYPAARVESVIFWGRQHGPVRRLRCGRATLEAHQVFLADMDGEAELSRLQSTARAGAMLGDGDILILATLPLMRHSARVWDVLEEAAPLAAALPADVERGVVTAMGALAYGALRVGERPRLLEVLGRMPAGQELFEALREEGRAQGRREGQAQGRREGHREGELRRARQAVLEAFEARFDLVPDAVRGAVSAATDLGLLSAWHRAVVRAPDAAAAGNTITDPR